MRNKLRILALSTVEMIFLFILGVPVAAGGGGCHQGVTSADATDGDAPTIEMIDACFTPTTLQIEPGSQVTFVSRDVEFTHNVGGNLWGHFEDMAEGDGFRATFDEAGTYPYACSYHPGMTGAIIVGDGTGAGNGELISVQAFAPPDPLVVTNTRTITAEASNTPWAVAGALGLVAGAAGGFGLARARRRPQAA